MSGEQKTTPATRELVRLALYDAIDWQNSLADAWAPGTPQRKECRERAKAYRKILTRRYGSPRTQMERALEGAIPVSIDGLRKLT